MPTEPKKYIIFVGVTWVLSICGSLTWNLLQIKNSAKIEHTGTAKAFMQQLMIAREWNSNVIVI